MLESLVTMGVVEKLPADVDTGPLPLPLLRSEDELRVLVSDRPGRVLVTDAVMVLCSVELCSIELLVVLCSIGLVKGVNGSGSYHGL